MNFADNLKKIRAEKGLKREDLAQKVDTSAAIIGRYERGERTPSIEIAKNLATALGISLDYLVGDTSVLVKDTKMLYRLEILQKIEQGERERILYVFDTLLRAAQNSSTQQKLA
ncbi:MAG: helix-turn-helix transcriptional regulator [Aureispira sp.]|nr:helix-turn-helix transcriptional regulator [Aureispira sp.]